MKDVTASASWSSSSTSVASVGNASGTKGMVEALALGNSTISAALQDANSGTVTGTTAVTVSAASLESIAVTPGTTSVALGLKPQFTATGTYSDSTTQDLTSSVTWSSSDTTVATVNAGKATTLKQGSSNIKATSGSVSGTAALSVTAASLASIAVSPASVSHPKGKKQQFTAQGTYTDGTTQNLTNSVTWSASTGATINNAGLATAAAVGSSTITAASGAVNGTAALTVTPAVLASINVSPSGASIAKGLTQQFTAQGVYTDGTTQSISVSWSSTAGATINSSGLATATAVGTPTITATSGAISGTTSLTVTPSALVSIAITPGSASIPKGLTQQFTATGTYTDGSSLNITNSVAWSSTTGATINATGVATGTAVANPTITATSGAISKTASLTVTPPVLVSVGVTPAIATIVRSSTQQFTATGTYTDGSTQNLTSSVAWSATAGATIAGSGLATGTAVGPVTITATSGAFSGVASLTVTQPAVVSIVVSPASVSLGLGAEQQYTAVATFADTIQEDITSSATWISGNTSVATFNGGGLAEVVGTSSSAIPITAKLGSITSAPAWLSALDSLPRVCPSPTIDMKLLVITNGQSEAAFPAIKQILDFVGTPYTVFDMAAQPAGITTGLLSDGECHGYYQGIIFTNGGYIYSLPGMQTLNSYEITFHARQVNWFTFPGPDFGLNFTGQTVNSRTANFTAAAAPVFFYANTNTPLAISDATIYLATPSGGSVTPLLSDSSGNVVSAIYDLGDGREYLTQTFDSNQSLTHGLVTAYGLLNWLTKGIFLGEYHVYATPQVDDLFIENHIWQSSTPCGTDPDDDSLPTYRVDSDDLNAFVAWQNSKQQNSLLSNFQTHIAFNGVGATDNDDDLVQAVQTHKAKFKWISHTWDHEYLDPPTNASEAHLEITQNNTQAALLGLPGYNPANLVTPNISGLNNAAVINQLVADGVRHVVTDTSVLGQPNNGPNPSPNVGIVNSINALLYEVPRHANNLFFNVSRPNQWTGEYHCIYAGQTPYDTFTYQQILDDISDDFVVNMLKGDMDPEMFHQANMRAYDGTRSLLGDLFDETFGKYLGLYKLPVLSPELHVLAAKMQSRNRYNLSGVTASLLDGGSSISITIPAASPVSSATIPVTGLESPGAEVYGDQNISHIEVNNGQTVTLPVQ